LATPIPVVGGHVTVGIGTHTIRWTASDGTNTATATQTVVVRPVIETSDSFTVEDRGVVRDGGGASAAVLNAGSGLTQIGNDADSGAILSVGPVRVLHRAIVDGSVTSAATVFKESDGTIAGAVSEHATVVLPALASLPTFPPATAGSFTVDSGTQSPGPGSYVSGTVNGGTLSLSAGDYFFDSFTINSGVTVRATATTRIFVKSTLAFRSPIRPPSGTAVQPMFLGFAGTGLTLEATFSGSLLAPNASVTMGAGSGLTFTGSFRVRSLDLRPASTLVCQ
jgi:hypothetical protein